MPIVTETHLRDQIRQPRQGLTITMPKDTRFSPSAMDFINHWKMEVVYGEVEQAADVQELTDAGAPVEKPGWDKPGTFPVVLSGDLPRCTTCGMPVQAKPEHMTQLDAHHYAPKNTPRIRLRGKMDTLHALFLLVLSRAKASNMPGLAERLNTLAAYCREMISAEYNRRRVEPLVMSGLCDDELHKATHDPVTVVGVGHVIPGPDDPEILPWLSLLRCQVREAEITVLDAFSPHGDFPPEADLVRAINRLSNAVYYLSLLVVAKKL